MVSVDMKTNEDKRPKRTRSAEIHNLSESVIFQINFDLKFPWKGYLIPHPSLTSYDQLDYNAFVLNRGVGTGSRGRSEHCRNWFLTVTRSRSQLLFLA